MDNQLQLHFIISAPRSGSTWLATALNHHPQVFATEQRLFGDFCEVWNNNDGTTTPRITMDKYAAAFGQHYFYEQMNRNYQTFIEDFKKSFINFLLHFAHGRTGKSIVVDKITPYPGTTPMVVKEIRTLFPEAKIIHLVRDGRDVLTSGTFDWLMKDADGTDRHKFYFDPVPGMKLERFFDAAVIKKWVKNWSETIDVFKEEPADHQITYEEMKEDMAGALQGMFKTLGVESHEHLCIECEEKTTFEAMTGRPPGEEDPTAKARKGIVGDWKNYFTLADGELFDALGGEQMAAAGYEANGDWVKQLPLRLNLLREPGSNNRM